MNQDENSEKSKEKIQKVSEVLDPSAEKIELEEETNSEEETGSVKTDSQFSAHKSPSLLKILGLAALVAGLFGSILINITLLSQGDYIASPTSNSTLQWVVIIAALLITTICSSKRIYRSILIPQ